MNQYCIFILRGQLSTEMTEFMYGFLDLKLYQKLGVKEEELIEASNSFIDKRKCVLITAMRYRLLRSDWMDRIMVPNNEKL